MNNGGMIIIGMEYDQLKYQGPVTHIQAEAGEIIEIDTPFSHIRLIVSNRDIGNLSDIIEITKDMDNPNLELTIGEDYLNDEDSDARADATVYVTRVYRRDIDKPKFVEMVEGKEENSSEEES